MAAIFGFTFIILLLVGGGVYTAVTIWQNGLQAHTVVLAALLLLALLFVAWMGMMVFVVGPHMRNM
jgi:hypothetical protein